MSKRLVFLTVLVFASEAFSSTTVKVAILDNNFEGYAEALGRTLPQNTTYHPGSVASPTGTEPHGLVMAQLLTRFLRGQSNRRIPYELHLYQTNGYTNFSEAVSDVIKNKIHVVLYAQVWEYGGNSDGRGFINSIVNQAVDAGVLWINASGNFALNTFTYPINPESDSWTSLPDGGIPVYCHDRRECFLRAVLSWNDFSDNVDTGTNKDLDFYLFDRNNEIVVSSQLIQRRMLDKGSEKFSMYPREIIETKLNYGEYVLKVKTTSKLWKPEDRLRITVSGTNISSRTNSVRESLLNPADNPRVVTVGSCDTADTSISISQKKPELIAPTMVNVGQNTRYMGSSVAATLVAAGAVALRSEIEDLSREKFLELVTRPRGQRLSPEWQWNVPNYSLCRPLPLDFVKLFRMPSF